MLEPIAIADEQINSLYSKPFPASRIGSLYNAFSYPTKISPEAIALFIATHTTPGAVVLDTFGGSGTTGIATLLCDKPTDVMHAMAKKMGLSPTWGARSAVIKEVGTLGSFVTETICNAPNPTHFADAASELLLKAENAIGWIYSAAGLDGELGELRHAIWSDVLECPHCRFETTYWDAAVSIAPAKFASIYSCTNCGKKNKISHCARVTESAYDSFLGKEIVQKKRSLARLHGRSENGSWQRSPAPSDAALVLKIKDELFLRSSPLREILWGDLHRAGYHFGISHLHHFYTRRNFLVMSHIWDLISCFEPALQNSLKLLALSYNSSHATLMSRVVAKKDQNDLVLTGAQSGVLYVSGLPVEKNILHGIKRKTKSLFDAFSLLHGSKSSVRVINSSSESIELPDGSVDYVFTDPPFGDYIPYAEVNQINEAWLESRTDRSREIAVSQANGKNVVDYQRMMTNVFVEIARTIKHSGSVTVVFHSAKAEIWRAMSSAFEAAELKVVATSILDKLQASFKQSNSTVSVQGDPLLLLVKGGVKSQPATIRDVMDEIIRKGKKLSTDESMPRRLYSRFVSRCLELGLPVDIDAKEFYSAVSDSREHPNEGA